MKKIFTTALAIVLLVGASQAQDVKGRREHRGQIAKELNLTEEQKAKLKTIHQAEKKEMDQLKANDKMTVGDWKAQRKAIAEKYRTQMESVLTPAQKEEWSKHQQQFKGDREGGKGFGMRGAEGFGPGRGLGQQAAFFGKELNLSSDQETKLKSIFQEFQTKAKDIRGNNSLSADQKKEQVRSLAKQYMDQGKTVLNAEQLKKLDEMRSKRKDRQNRNL